MRAIKDKVIIKVDDVQDKTKSGIIIPDTATESPIYGTVVSVGSGDKKTSPELKANDRVVVKKYAGTEVVDSNNDKFLVVREDDILCVF